MTAAHSIVFPPPKISEPAHLQPSTAEESEGGPQILIESEPHTRLTPRVRAAAMPFWGICNAMDKSKSPPGEMRERERERTPTLPGPVMSDTFVAAAVTAKPQDDDAKDLQGGGEICAPPNGKIIQRSRSNIFFGREGMERKRMDFSKGRRNFSSRKGSLISCCFSAQSLPVHLHPN